MSAIDLLAASPAFFIGACLLLGLLVGSFLNVVIYRLPVMLERQWREQCKEEWAAAGYRLQDAPGPIAEAAPSAGAPERFNLIVPRSACRVCKTPIGALQNIPLLSFLILGGRCSQCRAPISIRYPLVEALTGIASALVAWRFGFNWPAVAALLLTWFLIALTFIDIDHQLLPDSLTLPLLWLGLFVSLWSVPLHAVVLPVDSRSSLIGAMAGYVSLWSVYHLFRLATGKEGMGYGDFKLFAALGAWLGWQMLLPVIVLASAAGALIGVILIALRAQSRSTPIPFGPFLAAAGWLVLMFGDPLVAKYLSWFAAYPM